MDVVSTIQSVHEVCVAGRDSRFMPDSANRANVHSRENISRAGVVTVHISGGISRVAMRARSRRAEEARQHRLLACKQKKSDRPRLTFVVPERTPCSIRSAKRTSLSTKRRGPLTKGNQNQTSNSKIKDHSPGTLLVDVRHETRERDVCGHSNLNVTLTTGPGHYSKIRV